MLYAVTPTLPLEAVMSNLTPLRRFCKEALKGENLKCNLRTAVILIVILEVVVRTRSIHYQLPQIHYDLYFNESTT